MLEFFTKTDDCNAISLLKKDHTKVKGLFDQFEKADSLREKRKIVAEAIVELDIKGTLPFNCEKQRVASPLFLRFVT